MENWKSSRTRIRWTQGDELNKWVVCLGCDFEYFIESFELNPCCPVCESKEYDESTPDKDYMDLDELGELL